MTCVGGKLIQVTNNKLILFGEGFLFFWWKVFWTNCVNQEARIIWCLCRVKLTIYKFAFINGMLGERCLVDMHIKMIVSVRPVEDLAKKTLALIKKINLDLLC